MYRGKDYRQNILSFLAAAPAPVKPQPMPKPVTEEEPDEEEDEKETANLLEVTGNEPYPD